MKHKIVLEPCKYREWTTSEGEINISRSEATGLWRVCKTNVGYQDVFFRTFLTEFETKTVLFQFVNNTLMAHGLDPISSKGLRSVYDHEYLVKDTNFSVVGKAGDWIICFNNPNKAASEKAHPVWVPGLGMKHEVFKTRKKAVEFLQKHLGKLESLYY